MKEKDIDYERKYKRLRRKHEELKAALRFWLRGQFYELFMAAHSSGKQNYPYGEEFNKRLNQILRRTAQGQRRLNALGCPEGLTAEPLESET